MNPTVEAAWIAVTTGVLGIAGAVFVAVAANRNARKTNSQTIYAGMTSLTRTLDAAHEDKVWDKKSATYEEIIAYLKFIQARRRLDRRRRFMTYGKEYEVEVERLVGDYKPASWWELQARLAVYGSPDAIAGFEASHAANSDVADLVDRLTDLKEQGENAAAGGAPVHGPDIGDLKKTREELDEACERADETDQALVKLMRGELNRRPSQRGEVASWWR